MSEGEMLFNWVILGDEIEKVQADEFMEECERREKGL